MSKKIPKKDPGYQKESGFNISHQAKPSTAHKKLLGFLPSNKTLEKMKDNALGKEYTLNLVIADNILSKRLNFQYRGKDKPTDILSFPFSPNEGEIFLNLEQCKIKALKFDRTFENYLAFVFIHGLVHLKGFDHGSTMENEEVKIRKIFGV